MQISLKLQNLCKNTKIFLENIFLLKMKVSLDRTFHGVNFKIEMELDAYMQIST